MDSIICRNFIKDDGQVGDSQIDVQASAGQYRGLGNCYKCENDKELMREINRLISRQTCLEYLLSGSVYIFDMSQRDGLTSVLSVTVY